jgi:uncharacterized protein YbaP (TraB family)
MKAIITGLVLIALSGGALIWHLASRNAAVPPAGPVRTAKCMVWKAERGKAVVWLCGSFHLLREEDYPLPSPYQQAFEEAKVIVMESHRDPATAAERQEKIAALGRQPEGENLQQHLTPGAWETLTKYCSGDGPALVSLQSMRPWKAAFHLSNHHMARLGYSAARGLESHFSTAPGNRRLAGLETLEAQFAGLNQLDAATQEALLLKVVAEAPEADRRAAENIAAWREGDTRRLTALHDESMASLPVLKQLLFHDRHAAWLPKLEQYLEGTETVMVLVGSLHLCGRGSLIELLEAEGVRLTQMEYKTTRPAEQFAGNP